MLALLCAKAARGQFLTPNSGFDVPPVGHVCVETEYSLYRAGSFVDRDGNAQAFPGALDFRLGLVRVAYSPARHIATGVELPYRWSTFDEPEGEASLSSRGGPGVGVFVDWSPGRDDGHSLHSTLRIAYFRSRSATDQIPTISDGFDRYSATLDLASGAPSRANGWRAAGNVYVAYGPPAEADARQLESRVQFEAGRSIGRVRGSEICALGLIGYRSSTSARQEGVLFHDRTSQGAFMGLRLDWGPQPRVAGARVVKLSVVRDIRPVNALLGWRSTVSLEAVF